MTFVVDGLHALLAERAGVLDLLRAVRIGPAVDHAAGLVLLDQRGILEVVLVLELLLRVEVIERAEELVEPVRGRQRLVRVAQVVLAELRGHVALLLEQFGDRHVTRLQPFLRAGQADLQHARAEAGLAGDETRAAGGAALLAVPVGEQSPFLGDAVDVGRPVAHHAEVVGADVPVADVVAPENQDVRFLCSHQFSFRAPVCAVRVGLGDGKIEASAGGVKRSRENVLLEQNRSTGRTMMPAVTNCRDRTTAVRGRVVKEASRYLLSRRREMATPTWGLCSRNVLVPNRAASMPKLRVTLKPAPAEGYHLPS